MTQTIARKLAVSPYVPYLKAIEVYSEVVRIATQNDRLIKENNSLVLKKDRLLYENAELRRLLKEAKENAR